MTWYNFFLIINKMGHYYLMYSLNIPSLIFPNVIRPILHKSLIFEKELQDLYHGLSPKNFIYVR